MSSKADPKRQKRGQPGNRGQFAAAPTPQASPAPPHDVDLASQTPVSSGEYSTTWVVTRVEDGSRPGVVHEIIVAEGLESNEEATAVIAADMSKQTGRPIEQGDARRIDFDEEDEPMLASDFHDAQEQWFYHPTAGSSSWRTRLEGGPNPDGAIL